MQTIYTRETGKLNDFTGQIFEIPITGPPVFSPNIFFTKMTQNGLKWILNITFKTVTFFLFDPNPSPPKEEKFHGFFFFSCRGAAQHLHLCLHIWTAQCLPCTWKTGIYTYYFETSVEVQDNGSSWNIISEHLNIGVVTSCSCHQYLRSIYDRLPFWILGHFSGGLQMLYLIILI